jgi:pyruvate kinase
MNYQIVATLGPASCTDDMILALHAAGASGFRLNSSHLSPARLQSWLVRLERLFSRLVPSPPLVVDLQGAKRRLGDFSAFELVEQDQVELVCAANTRHSRTLPLPWPDLFESLRPGDRLLVNDARSVLIIENSSSRGLTARVLAGGVVSSRKGVTCRPADPGREPGAGAPRGPDAAEEAFIAASENYGFVCYALSYVESPAELASLRARCPAPRRLIAKLETENGLEAARAIAATADELWLCRGDLGAEMGNASMAAAVRSFSRRLADLPVPVLMAGQVLEHMTGHPQPTRSEVCHLADLLGAGYSGIVLSDETAVGRHPEQSCRAAALFRNTPLL